MSATDVTPRQPTAFRPGQAAADRDPIMEAPSLGTSRGRCLALGRPAVTGAPSGGTPNRPVTWRVRVASAASQRPAKQRVHGSGPPRLVADRSTPGNDRTPASRDAHSAGASGAGQSALDSARPRVARVPEAQGHHGRDTTRLTKRQLQFIHALAREYGVEPSELEWRSRQLFGAGVATLSRDDAKILIDRLARALDAVA